MRTLAVVLSLYMAGCSTIQRITNSNGMTPDEVAIANREEVARAEAERREEALKKQRYISVIKEGTPKSEFVAVWGEPDSYGVLEGLETLRYQNGEEPIEFYFRKKKMVGFRFDDAEAKAIQERRRLRREIADMKVQQAEENLRRSRESLGNVLNNIQLQNQINQLKQ